MRSDSTGKIMLLVSWTSVQCEKDIQARGAREMTIVDHVVASPADSPWISLSTSPRTIMRWLWRIAFQFILLSEQCSLLARKTTNGSKSSHRYFLAAKHRRELFNHHFDLGRSWADEWQQEVIYKWHISDFLDEEAGSSTKAFWACWKCFFSRRKVGPACCLEPASASTKWQQIALNHER